jgi:EmrB/QacA subfamily drug resistance transporter
MTAQPSVTTPQPAPATAPPMRRGLVIASLVLALVPLQLDGLVAATAAPTIAGDLGGFGSIAWIATTYLLTMAVGTVVAGRLGDMFGRKTLLLVALGVFFAGSLWAGLSTVMGELIAARAIQGIGAGMTFTTLLAVVADVAPPEKRARYQGLFGAVAPFSMIVGPWVGGIVTDHLGWRWIFLLNLPVVALAILGAAVLLRGLPRGHRAGRVDLAGIGLLAVASTGIVLAVTWGGHQHAWGSWQVLVAVAAAIVALLALVPVERRAAQPVLPPDLFRNRAVVASVTVMFLAPGAIMMAAINYLPLFLQLVQGRSASNSGLLLLPILLPAITVAMLTGAWTTTPQRFRPAMITGTAVLTLACALLATMDQGTSATTAAGLMMLAGAGIGLLFQTPLVLVQNSAPAAEVGAATGAANFLRTIGGAIGVGALGSLFTGTIARHTSSVAGGATGRVDLGSLTPNQLHALPTAAQQAVSSAVVAGSSALFWVAAAAGLVAVAAAASLPRVTARRRSAKVPEAA